MFWLKNLLEKAALGLRLLASGEWRRACTAVYGRVYQGLHYLWFPLRVGGLRSRVAAPTVRQIEVRTEHRVAFASPDHIVPHGTKYNNSTNRGFVTLLHARCCQEFPGQPLRFMDLGCSGGQLVADFGRAGWTAVGLEGSDYSLKTRRANWATLAGTRLFTCDITKPYQVMADGAPYACHLITAWEVMEHIRQTDLGAVFGMIQRHLVPGGYFIASTSSAHSIVDGVELHQTRMNNAEWKAYLAREHPGLELADLGLKVYQYVRYDLGENSFLVYRRKR